MDCQIFPEVKGPAGDVPRPGLIFHKTCTENSSPGGGSADGEAFGFQVAVVAAGFSGELQDAVIRIGNTLFVEDGVALPPDHVFGFLVCEDFHGALQHDAFIPDQPFMIKVDAGFGILPVLADPHGRSVGGEPEFLQAVPFPRHQHGFDIGKAVAVHGADEADFLLADECFNVFQVHVIRSFRDGG